MQGPGGDSRRAREVSDARAEDAICRGFHSGDYNGLTFETPDRLAGFLISRQGRGSLMLDGEDLRAYGATVEQLMKEFVKGDDLSRRSAETYLDDALFFALDLEATSTATFEERLKEGLETMRRQLTSPAKRYRCLVRVEGIVPDDLPSGSARSVSSSTARHKSASSSDSRPAYLTGAAS